MIIEFFGGLLIMRLRLVKNLNFKMIIIVLFIFLISLLAIASASHANKPEGTLHYTIMQAVWFIIGLLAMIFILLIDYNTIASFSIYIYIANILMLILVYAVGKTTMGAQRWIPIGPFSLQPSEFAKLALIISLSKHLEKTKGVKNLKDLIYVFIHVGIPLLLILKQPDLGTSLVLLAIMFSLVFVSGINLKLFFGVIGAGILSMPVLWEFLHDYQRKRILVFLNPNLDPLGAGYHVIQSKIAIGSGRILGKGLFHGTQNQLDFIPEQHTDFIFAVIGEEMGFIGSILLLVLFVLLIYNVLQIALKSKDTLGTFIATGVASMWTFQMLVNVGMTLGLMPVTGIPLPFVSYGGSSLLMNMMALGLVLNVGMRRQKILF